MDRRIIPQDFYPYSLTINAGTRQILSKGFEQADLSLMIESFIVCVPSASTNSVVLGGQNASLAPLNGLEIRPGIPIRLTINNTRQLYEVSTPLEALSCEMPYNVPVICWPLANIYIFSAVTQTIGGLLFPLVWV
jgi:hypothetical protein